jgi:hypothetical protein
MPEDKPKRKYTKSDKPSPEEIRDDAMQLSVEERACAHLATEFGHAHAAQTMGWSLQEVANTLNLPHVRMYLNQANEMFLKELARDKVRRMKKVGINRNTIEERLMALANMDPSDTKGSIEGQVKALRTLAEVMGYANEADPLAGKSPEELEAIVKKGHSQIEAANPHRTIN